MSIIKHKDKRTGVTYVYESESYWDKEKKQPRSKRTLIGKIDEETSEIIPTGKSGHKKADAKTPASDKEPMPPITDQVRLLSEKDKEIQLLKAENRVLLRENQEILKSLETLCQKLKNCPTELFPQR